MKDSLGFAIFAAKALFKKSWVDANVLSVCESYGNLDAWDRLSDFGRLFICTDDNVLRFFGMCFDAGMREDEVCEALAWAVMERYDELKEDAING